MAERTNPETLFSAELLSIVIKTNEHVCGVTTDSFLQHFFEHY